LRGLLFAALLTTLPLTAAASEPLALQCTPISTIPEARKDPITSIEVAWTDHAWRVTHVSASGNRYKREQQYDMTIASAGDGWNGVLRSRPFITMSARVTRSGQQFSYAETVFDARKGGAVVESMRSVCRIVGASASRAAMLIGQPSDPQEPQVNLGTAIWSIIPAAPGQPSTLAVRIEVEIPEQKMHATVTIRKNADPNLPATHTIDFRATFAEGAEIKGMQDIGLPKMRNTDASTGDALSGVRVKISDSSYLVGLTRSDADAAHNLGLLATRGWMDFPLLLNDERIAKLTFEKEDAGDRAMAEALAAWGEPAPIATDPKSDPQAETPMGEHTSAIPMQPQGGTFVVPVSINNAVTLNFVVDSGAADVSIPIDVVLTLLRTGTLTKDDFSGTTEYQMADGSKVPSANFRIRTLKVGDREIANVVGSVAKVEGSLLLGQSFLARFKSWSIDNRRQVLLLN
jgi:predicted aspartyl protease